MVSRLASADRVLIAGQTLSHSVNHTVRDLLKHWKPSQTGKIFLLKDCCSSLPGFESKAEEFMREISDQGVSVINSTEAFEWPELEVVSEMQPAPALAPDDEDDDLDDGEEDADEGEGAEQRGAADAENAEQVGAVDVSVGGATAEGNSEDVGAETAGVEEEEDFGEES